jgi:phenylalanyl-tRNA synthetase alpha subunit
MNDLDALVSAARELFAQAATPADLENAKAQFLGKSGRVTELMKGMAALSVEEKKTRGAASRRSRLPSTSAAPPWPKPSCSASCRPSRSM